METRQFSRREKVQNFEESESVMRAAAAAAQITVGAATVVSLE